MDNRPGSQQRSERANLDPVEHAQKYANQIMDYNNLKSLHQVGDRREMSDKAQSNIQIKQAEARQDMEIEMAKAQADLEAKIRKLEAELQLEREKNAAKIQMEAMKNNVPPTV